jgi:hypothetical protein
LSDPKLYYRPCEKCIDFEYDKSGDPVIGRDGKHQVRLKHMGKSFLAPCQDPERGCPKGTPESQNVLSEPNELCVEFINQCSAVGQWPDDDVVRRNAAVIREVKDLVKRSQEVEYQAAVLGMLKSYNER